MKRCAIGLLLAAVFITAFFSQTSLGQSCGGGKSFFHVFDESGSYEVKNVYISLHIVDENQEWLMKDFSKRGWKRQDFGEIIARKYQNSKTHESFETAFEVPAKEATR